MGFLTITNYIAMGVGYITITFVVIFFLWILVNTIKERLERKRWKRVRADKEKVKNSLEKESVRIA